MTMSTRKLVIALFALAAVTGWLLAVPSFADSQVRIVRLSDVEGDVQVDRNTGQGYEKAFLNLPITQGAKLRANNAGRAEVEFEDGSTVRITPGTVVEFPQLSLRDTGGRASTVSLREGTAYVNFSGANNGAFELTFGHEKLALTHAAHLRAEMRDTDATLAVFKGNVQVEGPSGTVEVGKEQSVSFDLTDKDAYTLAANLEQDPYDSWDKQQEQYHQRYVSNGSYNGYSPYAYGMSDLNYYGNYFYAAGYGMCWQPYFAGMGWDPFMNGAWMWYPGFGYTWISAYPWGWTPYRYGSWLFLPGSGWVWQPGRSGAGWNTIPVLVNPPPGFTAPQPPAGPGKTIIVNRGPITAPSGISRSRLIIRDQSAGLGIPRGSIRNLGKISQEVKADGSATATVHPGRMGTVSATPHSVGPASRPSAPRGGSPRMSAPSGVPHSAPSSGHSHASPH
jgi:FecR protein